MDHLKHLIIVNVFRALLPACDGQSYGIHSFYPDSLTEAGFTYISLKLLSGRLAFGWKKICFYAAKGKTIALSDQYVLRLTTLKYRILPCVELNW